MQRATNFEESRPPAISKGRERKAECGAVSPTRAKVWQGAIIRAIALASLRSKPRSVALSANKIHQP